MSDRNVMKPATDAGGFHPVHRLPQPGPPPEVCFNSNRRRRPLAARTARAIYGGLLLIGLAIHSPLGGAPSYWDRNDSAPGAADEWGQAAGLWGLDSNWSAAAEGTEPTGPWTPDDTAIFSAGADATGSFTVDLWTDQSVGAIHFEEGQVTVNGWSLTLTGTGGTIDVATNVSARVGSQLAGTVGLTKNGAGTLFFVNANTHTYTSDGGASTNTVISEGSLSVGDGCVNCGKLQDDVDRGHHIINHGRLIFDRADIITSFSGIISGSGSLTLQCSAPGLSSTSLKLASLHTNTYSGDTIIHKGRLQCGGASGRCIPTGPGKGNVFINTNGVLDVQGNNTQINGLSGHGVVTNSFGWNSPIPARTNILAVGDNDQSSTFAGVIKAGNNTRSNHVVLHKVGAGTLTLTGNNTYYAAPTVVHAGALLANNLNGSATGGSAVVVKPGAALGGTGAVAGPVLIEGGGTLSPGKSVGTLALGNDLTLAGNVLVEINKALSPANDFTAVGGVLTNAGTGTVTVTNLNPAVPLAVGDYFTLFSQPVLNGQVLAIASAGGVVWTNRLAVNGSIAVLSVGGHPPPSPATNLAITGVGPAGVSLVGAGAAHAAYQVFTCTNATLPLPHWWLLGTTNADAAGLIQYLDAQATNAQRFYRLGQPAGP